MALAVILNTFNRTPSMMDPPFNGISISGTPNLYYKINVNFTLMVKMEPNLPVYHLPGNLPWNSLKFPSGTPLWEPLAYGTCYQLQGIVHIDKAMITGLKAQSQD